jgi:putative zinc finger/helix-turn-helix YgiT family protein
MNIIKKEVKLCLSCMEIHEVQKIETQEESEFRNTPVVFKAVYEYCTNTEEYLQNEELIKANDVSFKNAYRSKMNLLTSNEIMAIRDKYCVSQKDFSDILGWGKATITRYENHQVQDEAHDEILRKLDSDPKWFIELLHKNKEAITEKAFSKYLIRANELFAEEVDIYLTDSIYAMYAEYYGNGDLTGECALNLIKTVEAINYIAMNVDNLFKVKLMKMLWYSDYLNYKRYKHSITGLVYRSLQMGAVPVGRDQIVSLKGVFFDEILVGVDLAYKFRVAEGFQVKALSREDIKTIDVIIKKFGHMNKNKIVEVMHREEAYQRTEKNHPISYKYANALSID